MLSNKEITQLQVEFSEFSKVQEALKDKETELKMMNIEMDELKPKVQTYGTPVNDLSSKEELTDQLWYTLKEGFQLVLDQVKILHPDVDVSGADITKEIVDGLLVYIC